jgi:hypothetical protein
MKRSEKLLLLAKQKGGFGSLLLMANVAACVWSFRLFQEHPLGFVLMIISLMGFLKALGMLADAFRLWRNSATESYYEWHREIRPRL